MVVVALVLACGPRGSWALRAEPISISVSAGSADMVLVLAEEPARRLGLLAGWDSLVPLLFLSLEADAESEAEAEAAAALSDLRSLYSSHFS